MLQILRANTVYETLCLEIKIWPLNGSGLGHVIHFDFYDPLCIFGTVADRNFVFGALIEYNMLQSKHDKLTPKVGVVMVTWPEFKTWDPSITFIPIKMLAGNFVCQYITWLDCERLFCARGSDLRSVLIWPSVWSGNLLFSEVISLTHCIVKWWGGPSSKDGVAWPRFVSAASAFCLVSSQKWSVLFTVFDLSPLHHVLNWHFFTLILQ